VSTLEAPIECLSDIWKPLVSSLSGGPCSIVIHLSCRLIRHSNSFIFPIIPISWLLRNFASFPKLCGLAPVLLSISCYCLCVGIASFNEFVSYDHLERIQHVRERTYPHNDHHNSALLIKPWHQFLQGPMITGRDRHPTSRLDKSLSSSASLTHAKAVSASLNATLWTFSFFGHSHVFSETLFTLAKLQCW
jgi:hypothetical protein